MVDIGRILFLFFVLFRATAFADVGISGVLVYAPNFLRDAGPYKILARRLESSNQLTVKAQMWAKKVDDTNGKEILIGERDPVEVDQLTEIVMDIEEDECLCWKTDLRLEIQVTDLIRNESDTKDFWIKLRRADVIILIQLSKPFFKPGETLQFRVITLGLEFIPVNVPVSVRIKKLDYLESQEHSPDLQKLPGNIGYFEGSYELPPKSTTSDWELEVTCGDQKESKWFQVAEYVSPELDISFRAPKYILAEASEFQLEIKVKRHSTQSSFTGVANVVVQGPNRNKSASDVMVENGSGVLVFNLTSLVTDALLDSCSQHINVSASIDHDHGTREQVVWETIPLCLSPFRIGLKKGSEEFRPGEKFVLKVAITDHDGFPYIFSPPRIPELKIFMNSDTSFVGKRASSNQSLHKLELIDGDFSIAVSPRNRTRRIDVSVKIGKASANITIFASLTSTVLHVSSLNPEDDDVVAFSVRSNCPYFDSVVVSTGNVVHSEARAVASPSEKISFPKGSMVSGRLLTYCITHPPSGGALVSSLDFATNQTQEKISLVVRRSSKAGSSTAVTLSVHGAGPDALVAFLAVDKRIAGTRRHDITELEALSKLQHRHSFGCSFAKADYNGLPTDLAEYLRKCGFVAWKFSFPIRMVPMVLGLMEPFSPFDHPPVSIQRKDFRDSFLFITRNADASGEVELSHVVPDTLTTWVFTAFALDNSHGIQFVKNPVEFSVDQKLFVQLDMTSYAVTTQNIPPANALIFNYFDKKINLALDWTIKVNSTVVHANESHFSLESGDSRRITIPLEKDWYRRPGVLSLEVAARTHNFEDSVLRSLTVIAP